MRAARRVIGGPPSKRREPQEVDLRQAARAPARSSAARTLLRLGHAALEFSRASNSSAGSATYQPQSGCDGRARAGCRSGGRRSRTVRAIPRSSASQCLTSIRRVTGAADDVAAALTPTGILRRLSSRGLEHVDDLPLGAVALRPRLRRSVRLISSPHQAASFGPSSNVTSDAAVPAGTAQPPQTRVADRPEFRHTSHFRRAMPVMRLIGCRRPPRARTSRH